jgi:hypothetical protein
VHGKPFAMPFRSSCCQMLLARMGYKRNFDPLLYSQHVSASRAQAATSSIWNSDGRG